MIPSVSATHTDYGQELSNWWMPSPELFCHMIVNSRLTSCQKCQVSTSAAKAEVLWTQHRFMCVGIDSFICNLSLNWQPPYSTSIFLRVQTLSDVGVWMFTRQTSGSQMHQLHCQLCCLPTTLWVLESRKWFSLFSGCTVPLPTYSCCEVADHRGF